MTFAYSFSAEEPFQIGTTAIPPYTEMKDGKIAGFATEIVEHVFQEMKVEYVIKVYPFKRALKYLKTGKLYGLYIAGKAPARAKIFLFPKEPLITTNWVWFINKENIGKLQYLSFDDLKGKRIGTIRGYYKPKDLDEYISKNCIVDEVTTEEQNFKKLAINRLDFVMSEYSIGKYFANKLGIDDKVIPLLKPNKSIAGPVYTHHLMFNKKAVSNKFVEEFSKILVKFKSTEEYNRMCKRYHYEGDDKSAVLRDMKY